MIGYALRRLAGAIPLALGILTLVFVLIEAVPGDPASLLLGDRPIPPETRARIVAAYGLDRPPAERYARWLTSFAMRGEMGWSTSRNRPVADVVAEAIAATAPLAGAALLLQCVGGIGLGILAASRHGGGIDRLIGRVGLVLYATPTFWLGLMAILGLSYLLPIFPSASMRSVDAETWSASRRAWDLLRHLTLPAAVLGLSAAAALARFVRAGLLRALGEPFVRAARARGSGAGRILAVHALRQAAAPAVGLLGLSFPLLVSGSLVVEVVFAWPGMGRLAYEAVLARDVPVVMACTLAGTLAVIAGNLLADLGLAALDPRVRLDGSKGASWTAAG